jgi:hypothetical protein
MVDFTDCLDLLLPGLHGYERRFGVRLGLIADHPGGRALFTDEDLRPLRDDDGNFLVAMTREEVEDNSYKRKWRERVIQASLVAGGEDKDA